MQHVQLSKRGIFYFSDDDFENIRIFHELFYQVIRGNKNIELVVNPFGVIALLVRASIVFKIELLFYCFYGVHRSGFFVDN